MGPDPDAALSFTPPARVEQALARALAMRPTDRYPTVTGFVDALRSAAGESGPRYGSAEIREIIGRAARIEADRVTEEALMSIGGVERLAAEVGVVLEVDEDADYDAFDSYPSELDLEPVDHGAPDLPVPVDTAPPPRPQVSGGVNAVHVERMVDAELPLSAAGALIELIGETLGPGQVTVWEGSMTWTPKGIPGQATRHVQIAVTPGGRQTRIQIDEQVEQVAGQLFGGIAGAFFGGLFGLTVGGGISGGEPSAVSLFGLLGTIGGAFTVSRSLGVNAVIQRERQHEALAGRLAAQVRRIAAPVGSREGAGSEARSKLE